MDPKTGLLKPPLVILLCKMRPLGLRSASDAAYVTAGLRACGRPVHLDLANSLATPEGLEALEECLDRHPVSALALRALLNIPERVSPLWTRLFMRISQDRILTEAHI